ncbi:hypothetical protein ACIQXD_31020 [Streptomyces uncialis]|uniref:hypothetical protein n=1 Tax=Streptomyces uncialis TaxID=1048205 RepID=UPI00380C1CD2
MSVNTTSRTSARLRLTAFAVLPVLALSMACVGGDDSNADGAGKDTAIAEVPAAPDKTDASPTKSGKKPAARSDSRSAFYDAQMTYIECMRAKGGYPDFPDPRLSGHPDWEKINAIGSQPGRNHGIKGGKNGVCVEQLQAVSAATPKVDQQKAYESMLAHAQCMRDNGVSKFVNPTMSGGNAQPGGQPNPMDRAFDEESPSYKQAREACASKLLDGLDGMQ